MKQFDFDEELIFDKFHRFSARLEKIIDVFRAVQQFKSMHNKKLDGMELLVQRFNTLLNDFKLKCNDLLDFERNGFERDFVEFAMTNSELENSIQVFICFPRLWCSCCIRITFVSIHVVLCV